jgi:amidohydrolase
MVENDILSQKEKIIDTYRWFHRHPEMSFQEVNTSNHICTLLESMGVPYNRVGKTSVVAEISDPRNNGWIVFRSDIDALGIREQTDLPWASENEGVMHACGHDSHMTILLYAIKYINEHKADFSKNIRFLFQAAEELPPGGAKELVENGVLDGVEAIYGLHNSPDLYPGDLCSRKGVFCASVDKFLIRVFGRGGHASAPEKTVDPVVVAAQIILALQTVVSRNVSPLASTVITIGAVHGGDSFNVITDEVALGGSVRTLSEEDRDLIRKRMTQIAIKTAEAGGATAKVQYERGYPSLVNHSDELDRVIKVNEQLGGKSHLRDAPLMGSEDFAYYTQKVPGAFVYCGAKSEANEGYGLHNSHYYPNEKYLLYGIRLIIGIAESWNA